jgi:outer membrane biosynthesis protein TonB
MRDFISWNQKNTPVCEEDTFSTLEKMVHAKNERQFFSQSNGCPRYLLEEPDPFVYIPSYYANKVFIEPINDIKMTTLKSNLISKEDREYFFKIKKNDILNSFLLHISFFLFCFIFNSIYAWKISQPKVIEISFGLTDQLVKTQQEVEKKVNDGETEATKTIEDLPQLIKNSSPDQAPKPNQSNETHSSDTPNEMIYEQKNKIDKHHEQSKHKDLAKNDGKLIPKKQNIISEKDYLQRKEEDLRKIAIEKKKGIHGKDSSKPDGQKNVLSTLPKSPFQSADDIPDAPPGLAPTGEESGIAVADFNTYRLYLKNQLRLNWSIHEGVTFSNKLKCTIEFTVNAYGYLIGIPKISKSSGTLEFDNYALEALKKTFPVETAPPRSIHPPQTFQATYNGQNVD